MGNLFSKKLSLNDKLIELEDSTIKLQYEISTLKRSNCLKSVVLFSTVILILGFYYGLVSSLIGLVCSLCWTYIVFTMKKWRIQNKERKLAEMNETRKFLIEQCKKDREFSTAKSIIERYEDEECRSTFFKQLQKRKQSTMDNVTDFILGKDPSKMNALICTKCGVHNGLVDPMNDEFKEFRCYSCNFINTRK